MKRSSRQPFFRVAGRFRAERRRPVLPDQAERNQSPTGDEKAAEIVRFRLMKETLDPYWASRLANR